jgi:hypothetical protein
MPATKLRDRRYSTLLKKKKTIATGIEIFIAMLTKKSLPGQWKILNIAAIEQAIIIIATPYCKPLIFRSFSNCVNSIEVEEMIRRALNKSRILAPGQCSILKNVPKAKTEKAIVGIFAFMVFILKLVINQEL